MERLTHVSDGYYAVDRADCWEDQNEEYSGHAIDRLADYEDTGLEPCDYAAMKAALEQADTAKKDLNELIHIVGAAGVDHLQELAQAEKDGRLVVLPCKVGSPVYRIGASICKWRNIDHCDYNCSGYEYEDCWEGERTVLEEKFSLDMLDFIGKTVFLNREDAESVLCTQKGGNRNGRISRWMWSFCHICWNAEQQK